MVTLRQIMKNSEIPMVKETALAERPCGIETEYGVIAPGYFSPILAGIQFVYTAKPLWTSSRFGRNIRWDPAARFLHLNKAALGLDLDEHAWAKDLSWLDTLNRICDNGARFYADGPQAEMSTPICLDPRSLVIWDRACHKLVEKVRRLFLQEMGIGFQVFRNNWAQGILGEDNVPRENPAFARQIRSALELGQPRRSFACHVNTTISRLVPEDKIIRACIPFFIQLTPVVGAGKVGSDNYQEWTDYQISQRADWFEMLTSLHTTKHRPIYNLRDVPYADLNRFRRVHKICFDSNMLELPTYLKAGLTSILFAMLEDGETDDSFWTANPLETWCAISRDTDLRLKIATYGSKKAVPLTDHLLRRADLFEDYLRRRHPHALVLNDVAARFRDVVQLLAARDWEGLKGKSDWVTKRFLVKKVLDAKRLSWQSPMASLTDLQYHNNAADALFAKLERSLPATRISTDLEVETAIANPPATRARWVTEILEKYPRYVLSSDYWYRIRFNHNGQILTLYMEDPYVPWDEGAGRALLALPFEQFLQQVTSAVPSFRVTTKRLQLR